MANAKGRARTNPHQRPSPAQTAALIGVAALVFLLGFKLVGIIDSGTGKDLVARASGTGKSLIARARSGAGQWLERLTARSGGAAESPVVAGLMGALAPFGIDASDIQRQSMPEVGSGRRRAERWDVRVPARVSLVQVNLAVTRAAPDLGIEVLDAWEEAGAPGTALTMALGSDGSERYRLAFRRKHDAGKAAGRVAIIINGIGADWDGTSEALLGFSAPITWGVLPGYRSSKDIARAARAKGIEVLLSLPMEPRRFPQVNPGDGAILVHLTPAEVRARMRRALGSVGEVTGIVPYMGSMAVTDADLMRVVLDEVMRQDLFLVDSRAAPQSQVSEVARQLGVRCIESALFVDGEGEPQVTIAKRLARIMDIAAEKGEAVAIGHSYPQTLAALEAALPEFAARGLELVQVSDLVQARAPAEMAGSL